MRVSYAASRKDVRTYVLAPEVHGESTGKAKWGDTTLPVDLKTMQTKRLWRSLISIGAVAVLALQFLGALTPSLAHASSLTLRITEINWAGSNGHPTDEWIELQNVSGGVIDFAATPYTLEGVIGGTTQTLATLGAADGTLNDTNYLVLTREAAPSGNSTLLGANANARYIQEPALDLPDQPTAYHLLDSTSALADSVDDGGFGIPFAGSNAGPMASMARVDASTDGNQPGNWRSSHTMGVNFVANSPEQWATPGEANVEVAEPFNVSVNPPDSTTINGTPVVSGTTATGVVSATATFTRASYTPVPYSRSYSGIFSSANGGPFVIAPLVPTLDPGRYLIDVIGSDLAGHHSASVHVPVAVGVNEYNYVKIPTSSPVPSPTLDSYPGLTNQPTVTISGTLDTIGHVYNSVEILRNGRYLTTVPADVGGATFTSTLGLLPDTTNTFSFMAVDDGGVFSVPAVATVVNDSTKPDPVVASKVTVGANPAGSADTIQGQPGAAEPATTLWVYSDSALTQQIASAPVDVDGSFPLISIGDNLYNRVYLVLQDAAGNVSDPTAIDNPTGYVGGSVSGLNLTVSSIGATQVTLTWSAVSGASSYHLKYRTATGAYGQPATLCTTGNTGCTFTSSIMNLQQDTDYVVAMAVVDKFGNESAYVEKSVHTSKLNTAEFTGVGGNFVPAAASTTNGYTYSSPATGATDTVQKSEATPSPTPEQGQVKSTTDEKTRNWTPWIILLILILIAVLATAAYFYWFGGEAGEAAVAGLADRNREDTKPEKPTTSTRPTRRTSGNAPPKKPSKEKRW